MTDEPNTCPTCCGTGFAGEPVVTRWGRFGLPCPVCGGFGTVGGMVLLRLIEADEPVVVMNED